MRDRSLSTSIDPSLWEQLAWPGVVHLAAQTVGGLDDLADSTRVPPELGLRVDKEDQHVDVFQRGVVADVLLDCSDLLGRQLEPVIEHELDYLMDRRRTDGRGWSYLPEVPEFPPDSDTLSSVMIALLGAGRRIDVDKYCRPAVEFVLRDCLGPAGMPRTWLVPDAERSGDGRLPEPWLSCLVEGSGDADVIPSLLYALHVDDPRGAAEWVARGADYLERVQRDDGGWVSPFYCGRFYVVYACLRFFGAVRPESPAVTRALELLRAVQQDDGGWGRRSTGSDPLSTALALLALASVPDRLDADDIARSVAGARYLSNIRGEDRLWPASPFFWRLEEAGKIPAMIPYMSTTLTCALVVKSCLMWRRLGV